MELGINLAQIATWILLISVTILVYSAWRLFVTLWLKPLRTKRFLESQGLKGMPYRSFFGNVREFSELNERALRSPMPEISHDITPRIHPDYVFWGRELGNPFFFWFGPEPRIYVTDPELAREILSNKFGHYQRPKVRPETRDLMGMGLVLLEAEKWAQRRRIVNPAFFIEKLKAMTPTMAACTVSMLNDWETQIKKEASRRKEIDVQIDFSNLTGDIIAHTAFGSSYAEGKQVFQIQHEQQALLDKLLRKVYIPGSRFIPTQTNRYRWKLDKQIKEVLGGLIQRRTDAIKMGEVESYGNDLLGLMMAENMKEVEGNEKNVSMDVGEMVDECKTFFFAGHETTSTLLTWSLLVLGTSIRWQERARDEVLEVCGKETPTSHSLQSLKTVTMILYEVLRLYPPAPLISRQATKNTTLGTKLVLPKGTTPIVPILAIHHDPKYWGPDADLFNPQRFANGIAKAGNDPAAFMPFGAGPRICVGQNFALLEAKIALALILQRFSFHISPTYTHAPCIVLTLQPQFGMQIVFEMLPPTD